MSLFILPQRELNTESFNVENDDDFVYMLEQTLGYEVAKYCEGLVNASIEADEFWEMYSKENEKRNKLDDENLNLKADVEELKNENEQLKLELEKLKQQFKSSLVVGHSFVFNIKE